MHDWIEATIELYPKTRLLGEYLNRREYDEAYMLAAQIEADMKKLRWFLSGLLEKATK